MTSNTQLMPYLAGQTEEMVAMLRQMVEMESPTHDKDAVDRLGDFVADELSDLGADTDRVLQADRGDHVWARLEAVADAPQATILTHIDTVWPVGTLAGMPWRRDDGHVYGPGVLDMKAGIVIGLFALRAIRELDLELPRPIVWLSTSDEEVGSTTSRVLIEEQAERSAHVLVLEPGQPPYGALKTQRKGVGRFVVQVTGRASHSGLAPEEGISAIEELARLILQLHSLTDHERGVTVNVGVISGGTRPNVIAAQARADVDLRVTTVEDGEKLVELIYDLAPHLQGAEVEITGGLTRPPMERTPGVAALFEQAQRIGQTLGLALTETSSGGASDGNFTAALGIPTLDGLGAIGTGAHAAHEQVQVSSIPERAALLAALLTEF